MLLLERVERQALADRQAALGVAIAERWEDYEPVSIPAAIAEFEARLDADPNDSEEARAARHIAELTGAA